MHCRNLRSVGFFFAGRGKKEPFPPSSKQKGTPDRWLAPSLSQLQLQFTYWGLYEPVTCSYFKWLTYVYRESCMWLAWLAILYNKIISCYRLEVLRGFLLYKLYRYVPPHWVGFLRRFVWKRVGFAHCGRLESGMVFEGTTGVYERIYRFNSKWVRTKVKYANTKWVWRIFLFAL